MKKQIVAFFNGPVASGKSSIAERLARMSNRGVYIEVDLIRTWVKGGNVIQDDVEKGLAPNSEYEKQHLLAAKIACFATKIYLSKGFNVFISDQAYFPRLINLYFKELKNICRFFLLFSELKTNFNRYKERREKLYYGKDNPDSDSKFYKYRSIYDKLYKKFSKEGWEIINTTDMNLEETVNYFFNLLKIR